MTLWRTVRQAKYGLDCAFSDIGMNVWVVRISTVPGPSREQESHWVRGRLNSFLSQDHLLPLLPTSLRPGPSASGALAGEGGGAGGGAGAEAGVGEDVDGGLNAGPGAGVITCFFLRCAPRAWPSQSFHDVGEHFGREKAGTPP